MVVSKFKTVCAYLSHGPYTLTCSETDAAAAAVGGFLLIDLYGDYIQQQQYRPLQVVADFS